MVAPALSAVGETARTGDPDRFRAALFAAPARREALFALIAFNHELEKIGWTVSEPMLGEIRLAWWREAVADLYENGVARGHPVIEALAVDRPRDRAALDGMIDARAFDIGAEGMADDAALDVYLAATSGALTRLLAEALGADEAGAATAAEIGWAEGAGRMIAGGLAMMSAGLRPCPLEEGAVGAAFASRQAPPELSAWVKRLAERALPRLAAARAARGRMPRPLRAPLLSAHVAERALKAAVAAEGDLFALDAGASPFRATVEFGLRGMTGRY